ncbi:hypothetical protein [Vibrio crassostreae]|uniref:hypothetical protein n=1 Tax=Vibrio crassostreae TaxID=246167 RepID=UPI001B313096|nr:hypothetical protein [Vibrio crassostreae]
MKFDEQKFLEFCAEYDVVGKEMDKLRSELEGKEFENSDEFHWEFCIADGDRRESNERSNVWALNAVLAAEGDVIGKEFVSAKGDRFGIILPCQEFDGGIKVAVYNETSAITHKSFQGIEGVAGYLVEEGLVEQTEGKYESIASTDKFIETTSKLADSNKIKPKF